MAQYPPSFDGNPLSYGFALFSLTLICAFSIATLLHFLFESRLDQLLKRQMPGYCPSPRLQWSSPLSIHRMIVTGFLFTILFGAFPDVLVLFAWGEGTRRTMDILFLLDRIGDALTFVPFTAAIFLTAWGSQVVPQQLVRDTPVGLRRPTWRTVRDQFKIVGMVLIIAAGVTLAKASAGT